MSCSMLSVFCGSIYKSEKERLLTNEQTNNSCPRALYIIESVDSISRDERDVPLTQYITNA